MKLKYTLGILLAVICLASVLIVWVWTRGGFMILGHDTGYRIDTYGFFTSLFYTWIPAFNVGQPYLPNSSVVPIHFPEFIASMLTTNPRTAQQLVLIYWHVIMFMPFLLSLIFIPKKQRKQSIVMLAVAGLLYSINFFNLHGFSVIWRARFSIQFLMPVLFFFVWYTLAEGRIRIQNLLLVALLTSFLNGGGSPPLLGAPVLVWGLTGLFGILVSREKRKSLAIFVKATFYYGVVVSLLSAYWLLPYISYAITSYSKQLTQLGGVVNIVIWSDMVSKNTSFLNLFRLQALPAWDFDTAFSFVIPYLTNPLLILGGFVTVALAVCSILYVKTREQRSFVAALIVLLLVGMFLSAGTHPPTGLIYSGLLQFVPGFAIFRTPLFKFGMVIHFALSLLAGFTIQSFVSNLKGLTPKFTVYFLLILFVYIYHAPYLIGNFFDYNPPFTNKVKVPPYAFEVATWINKHSSPYGRVLMLPQSNDGADSYTWGYWSPDPFPQLILNRPLVGMSYNPSQVTQNINNAFNKSDRATFIQLLTRAGIDTILWRGDYLGSDKITTSGAYLLQKQALITPPVFNEVYRSGQWIVYSVEDSLPRFTVPRGLMSTATDTTSTISLAGSQLPGDVSLIQSADPRTNSVSPLVVEATDVSCTPESFMNNQATIPTTRILPTSIFYPLAKYREAKQIKNISVPFRRNLFITGKRMYEITEMVRRGLSSRARLAIPSLIDETNTALEQLEKEVADKNMSTEDKLIIKQHLVAFNDMLVVNEPTYETVPGALTLFTHIGKLIQSLSKLDICTTIPTTRTYNVSLPQNGAYIPRIVGNAMPLTIRIDNQFVEQGTPLLITKGAHTITVTHMDNAFERTPEDSEINVFYGSTAALRLIDSGFLPTRLSLQYRVIQGIAPDMTFNSGQTSTKLSSPAWQQYTKPFSADEISLPLDMKFTICCYQYGTSVLQMRNIVLSTDKFPKVFLVNSQPTFVTFQKPKISFWRENITRYRIHVEDAKEPFYLQFNELFDDAWRATIVKSAEQLHPNNVINVSQDGKVIEYMPKDRFFDLSFLTSSLEKLSDHTMTNGYANLWKVDKTGKFDIVVEFSPQKFMEYGALLTALSLTIVIFILIRSHLHHGNNL